MKVDEITLITNDTCNIDQNEFLYVKVKFSWTLDDFEKLSNSVFSSKVKGIVDFSSMDDDSRSRLAGKRQECG